MVHAPEKPTELHPLPSAEYLFHQVLHTSLRERVFFDLSAASRHFAVLFFPDDYKTNSTPFAYMDFNTTFFPLVHLNGLLQKGTFLPSNHIVVGAAPVSSLCSLSVAVPLKQCESYNCVSTVILY